MRSGYVVTAGIRLYYVEQGEGPLVLLCHGFPEHSYSWRHQLAPLAEAGFRAVAVDLPGYGRSDKPDVTYDVDWLCGCLAGVVRGLGARQAVMVGHDWGGLLVWPFARMYAAATAGVIGLNTPDLERPEEPPVELMRRSGSSRTAYIVAFQERGAAEAWAESDLDGFLRLFFLGPATVRKEVFTDEVLATYAEPLRPAGATTPPLEYYRNIDRNWDLLARFDGVRIEVPCLLISGAGDPVLRPEMAEGMEKRVPDLTKVVIDDCGHWTQQEQPDRTTEAMLEYLSGLEKWS
ncbi:MAG: alpha/beta fold hydrolase [Actinomycetota bacterium]